MSARTQVYGMIAEFESPGALLSAAEKMRDAGYTTFDCHSPFPIHGMDTAMGLKRSIVGYVAGICGLAGGSFGLALQWWTSVVDYPLVISGKPFFSYQAFVPVTFALTVLCAAIGVVIAMLVTNGLPRLFHGWFYSSRFTRFSNDGFFVSVEVGDKRYDPVKTKAFLESIGGTHVEVVQGE
ncbi:MAG: DUF3341 domain-containing protein [candidate division Zixibacteria bacterium]|nr:DUF3341 domain-containing protein [candidate division Zixibacteria bacterium]